MDGLVVDIVGDVDLVAASDGEQNDQNQHDEMGSVEVWSR